MAIGNELMHEYFPKHLIHALSTCTSLPSLVEFWLVYTGSLVFWLVSPFALIRYFAPLSAVISIAQAVLNLCVSRKFSLNIKLIGIQFAVQCRICPGVTFGLPTILLRL